MSIFKPRVAWQSLLTAYCEWINGKYHYEIKAIYSFCIIFLHTSLRDLYYLPVHIKPTHENVILYPCWKSVYLCQLSMQSVLQKNCYNNTNFVSVFSPWLTFRMMLTHVINMESHFKTFSIIKIKDGFRSILFFIILIMILVLCQFLTTFPLALDILFYFLNYYLLAFPPPYLQMTQSRLPLSAATAGQRGPLWGCWVGTDRFHLQKANEWGPEQGGGA